MQFLRLPADERRLVVEATCWVSVARLALLMLPFRWIAPRLGRHMGESAEGLRDRDRERAHQVARAVTRASRYVQEDRNCLIRAMADMAMLRRRGQGCTLYLGVRRQDDGQLRAHAWLRIGDLQVTGGRLHADYAVVSRFTTPGMGKTRSGSVV